MKVSISVITVVYNRYRTISQAIESVISQTYDNVEYVVIDGESTDGTLSVLKTYRSYISKLVSEPDNGIYDALNKGLALATGDVIGLMHSDDYYANDRILERVAAAFVDPEVDAVYGDLDYVEKDHPWRVVRRWRSGQFTPLKLSLGWMPPHPTLFLRRSVIEQYGGFDTSFQIAADYDAILRYFGKGNINSVYIPYVFVKMRIGGESNRSITHILRKSLEDYRALHNNGVSAFEAGTLVLKNLSKLRQLL